MYSEAENRIRRKLRRTANALRLIGTFRAGLLCIIALFLYAVAGEVLDSFFVLSRPGRAIFLAAGLSFLVAVPIRKIFSLWTKRITLTELAAIYERKDPELAESLFSAVTCEVVPGNELNAALVHHTCCKADRALAEIGLRSLFLWGNLAALTCSALVLLTLVATAWATNPERSRLWFARMVCLSNEKRPPRTLLWLNEPESGIKHVRTGDPLDLLVCSAMEASAVADRIEILCRYDDGTCESFSVTRSRESRVKRNAVEVNARVFVVPFTSVLRSFDVTVRGGDAECSCRVIATEPPAIIGVRVRQTFPDYMRRLPIEEDSHGAHVVPEGTSLLIRLLTDRKARQIHLTAGSVGRIERDLASDSAFTISIPSLRRSARAEVELSDEYGITSKEPISIRFDVVPDKPPTILAAPSGTGRRITSNALIPWHATVSDDFGINSIYLGTRKEEDSDFIPIRLALLPDHPVRHACGGTFDTSLVPLQPGDRLFLRLEASDFKPSSEPGNVYRYQTGIGPVWEFEVVEHHRLKEILEAEEFGWRDRLANLIREVERTKAALVGSGQETTNLRIARDVQKECYDTGLIARGIAGMCGEIENNRLAGTHYVAGYLQQLLRGVVRPLESLAEREMASLHRRLSAFGTTDKGISTTERAEVAANIDHILAVLNGAIAHMRTLQSFQSLADEFRVIRKELRHSKEEADKQNSEMFHELEKE